MRYVFPQELAGLAQVSREKLAVELSDMPGGHAHLKGTLPSPEMWSFAASNLF